MRGIIDHVQTNNQLALELNNMLGEVIRKIMGVPEEKARELAPPRKNPECLNDELDMLDDQMRTAMGNAKQLLDLFDGCVEPVSGHEPRY